MVRTKTPPRKASPSARKSRIRSSGEELQGGRPSSLSGKKLKQALEDKRMEMELRLLEHSLSIFDVPDPSGIWADKQASEIGWTTVGLGLDTDKRPAHPVYRTDESIAQTIRKHRLQEESNPYARNLYQNRINYIIGSGTKYKVRANNKSGRSRFASAVSVFVRDWLSENNWDELQQEVTHRTDRDGECFARIFRLRNSGMAVVRIVEPFQVRTPDSMLEDTDVQFGVRFDPKDAIVPKTYYVFYGPEPTDYETVPAEEMIHFKGNVDANAVRGLPIANAAYTALEYASKLLRNMAVVTTIQASVAMIRKHGSNKPETVKNFRDFRDATPAGANGQTPFTMLEYAGQPRILDTTSGYDYEFPAVQIDVSKMVAALQASLRAAASSVQMPEFMLTADASNANYSSSMVSEGPAVRSFGRAQNFFAQGFLEILYRSVLWAMRSGRIPDPLGSGATVSQLKELIEIRPIHPELKTKKNKEETDKRKVLRDDGILSPQQWALEEDLDYEEQQALIEQHITRLVEMIGRLPKTEELQVTIDPTGKVTLAQPPAPAPSGTARKSSSGGRSSARGGRSRTSPKPRPSRGT